MKLFTKYNRINIAASVVVFVVGSAAFYFVLRLVLLRELDGALHTEQTEIIAYVQKYHRLPEVVKAYNQQITFTPVPAIQPGTVYFSEKVRGLRNEEMEWARKLQFGIT